jgi:hypothetical protein
MARRRAVVRRMDAVEAGSVTVIATDKTGADREPDGRPACGLRIRPGMPPWCYAMPTIALG